MVQRPCSSGNTSRNPRSSSGGAFPFFTGASAAAAAATGFSFSFSSCFFGGNDFLGISM